MSAAAASNPRVVGIGGIFIRAKGDADELRKWYQRHLGIDALSPFGTVFHCPEIESERKCAVTAWSILPSDSTYMGPATQSVMINYRVADLEAVMAQLRSEGVKVDDKIECVRCSHCL